MLTSLIHKDIFGREGMIYCLISIGVIGYFVWAHVKGLFFINIISVFCIMLIYKEVIYFAICWNSLTLLSTFNSKNLNNYTQSAGNLLNRSTSETTREISFNFDQFYKKYEYINFNWLTWFIGFSEGDGCIAVYDNKCRFIISQKEGDILYHIKNVLKIGQVSKNKDGYYRYSVSNKDEIMKLSYIFNGNLCIPYRIKQLSLWFIINNESFISKPVLPTLKDSWLSGFTDAEGCFSTSIIKRKDSHGLAHRVKLRFILDQNNFKNNFMHISSLFNNSGFISLRPNSSNQYRFTIESYKSIPFVISYFNNYPLKTNKSYSYFMWLDVFKCVMNKEHLTREGLLKIREIIKKININNSKNNIIGSSLKIKI